MDGSTFSSGRGTRPGDACADPVGVTGPVARLRAAAAAVGGVRVESLDADAAVEVVLAARWAQAAATAVEADALARLEDAYPDGGLRGRGGEHAAVVFELMAALGCSQRSAANRLCFGWSLAELPALGEQARVGGFDVPMLLLVLDRVGVLPEDLRAEAVDRLVEAQHALPGGLTRAQAGRLLGRIVAGLDPDGAARRQRVSRRGRRVWHDPGGAAGEESTLGMTGPAERVGICFEVVDALARAICADPRTGGGGATLEQARFDALEWLVTGHPAHTHQAWPTDDADDRTDPETAGHAETGDGHARTDGHAQTGVGGGAVAEDVPPWELPLRRDMPETRDETDDTYDTDGVGGVGADGDGDADHRDAACVVDGGGDLRPGEGGHARDGDAGPEPATGGNPGVFAAGPGTGAGAGGAAPGSCGCGRPGVRVGVTAHITVSLATLLGLDDAPGELAGTGPVPAPVARELAAAAGTWRRLLTDPADGHLLTAPIRAYRPTAAVREFVLARAGGGCASRGCTARHGLQIDHDIPWPHGPTGAGNTVPLHQPHHDAKTCGAWCHRLHGETGALSQTSPLGRSYTTVPLPPLADIPPADPDLTTTVRNRLHRLTRQTRRRPGHRQPTGPPDHAGPAG